MFLHPQLPQSLHTKRLHGPLITLRLLDFFPDSRFPRVPFSDHQPGQKRHFHLITGKHGSAALRGALYSMNHLLPPFRHPNPGPWSRSHKRGMWRRRRRGMKRHVFPRQLQQVFRELDWRVCIDLVVGCGPAAGASCADHWVEAAGLCGRFKRLKVRTDARRGVGEPAVVDWVELSSGEDRVERGFRVGERNDMRDRHWSVLGKERGYSNI